MIAVGNSLTSRGSDPGGGTGAAGFPWPDGRIYAKFVARALDRPLATSDLRWAQVRLSSIQRRQRSSPTHARAFAMREGGA